MPSKINARYAVSSSMHSPIHTLFHAFLQFLDAFAGDAAWLARYARSRDGQPIPWEVIEAHKKATHPYSVSSCGWGSLPPVIQQCRKCIIDGSAGICVHVCQHVTAFLEPTGQLRVCTWKVSSMHAPPAESERIGAAWVMCQRACRL